MASGEEGKNGSVVSSETNVSNARSGTERSFKNKLRIQWSREVTIGLLHMVVLDDLWLGMRQKR